MTTNQIHTIIALLALIAAILTGQFIYDYTHNYCANGEYGTPAHCSEYRVVP